MYEVEWEGQNFELTQNWIWVPCTTTDKPCYLSELKLCEHLFPCL